MATEFTTPEGRPSTSHQHSTQPALAQGRRPARGVWPVSVRAGIGVVGVAALWFVTSAAAQVSLSDEPMHRAVYANADLRVIDVLVPPGQSTLDHRHERDLANVSMNPDAETRVHVPGQAAGPVRPRRPVGNAAIGLYAGASMSHRIENVSQAPYHLFAVENLRASGWSTAAPITGALGTTMTNDSRAFRTYDVRMGRDAAQTSHLHEVPTIVVLVSGFVMSEGPDAKAKAFAPASVGMKQLAEPGQWLLVPAGDRHHLVRLSNGEARVVEIEVR
jgi:quercetin dioxygenase-like cupin family protein